jgi:nucleoside 2-deoxyribosyltransferase
MKVYLAGAFERREEMREVRNRLNAFGYTVTSRWIDILDDVNPIGAADLKDEVGLMRANDFAIADLHDVYDADLVIMFSGGGRGGRHIEFGYAVALDKELIIVGERENVFHALSGVVCVPTVDDLYRHLVGAVVVPS